jgi:tetratricopeptide (TPR) repeat protein
MEQSHVRGQLLYSHGRYADAEAEFRKALGVDADDPIAHSMLALCLAHQERPDEALAEAQTAVGQAPDVDFVHYALALVHVERQEFIKARAAIDEALRIDPEDEDFWGVRALIHAARGEHAESLDAAQRGLAIAAEDPQCQNLKALALTHLGRHEEAATAIEGQLQREPDNAMTHANLGWALLHRNQPKQAAVHFREALRIDPELEFARAGMVNALRARNVVFRLLLAYFLWMSRLSRGARWGVVIGGYLAYQVLREATEQNPEIWLWTAPLIVAYLLFVFLTWTGSALSNLLLRLDRFGRHVLSADEVRASNFVGASLLLAVGCGIAALFTRAAAPTVAAVLFLLMIIPIAGTFNTESKRDRIVLAIYTGLLLLVGLLAVGCALAGATAAACPGLAFMLGLFAFTWIAAAMHMRTPG